MNDFDRDLEHAFREAAKSIEPQPDWAAVVDDATPAPSSFAWITRRPRSVVLGAAIFLALAVGASASLLDEDSSNGDQVTADQNAPSQTAPSASQSGWRTEYWGGVAIDVPTGWGYGGAPFEDFDGGQVVCSELRTAEGERATGALAGYVGRPVATTDACAIYPWIEHSPHPEEPFVWLGGAVDTGTVLYENGFVQETVEHNGISVTVGAHDTDTRQRILASLRTADSSCDPTATDVPNPDSGLTTESRGELLDAWICAYVGEPGGPFTLAHAAAVTREDAEAAFLAQEQAQAADAMCDPAPDELVVLHATYNDLSSSDDLHRVAVYQPGWGCGQALLGNVHGQELVTTIVQQGVEPWADGVIRSTISGTGVGEWQYLYFIGTQG